MKGIRRIGEHGSEEGEVGTAVDFTLFLSVELIPRTVEEIALNLLRWVHW